MNKTSKRPQDRLVHDDTSTPCLALLPSLPHPHGAVAAGGANVAKLFHWHRPAVESHGSFWTRQLLYLTFRWQTYSLPHLCDSFKRSKHLRSQRGTDPLNANPAFGFAATFLTQFHPGKREESKLYYAVLSASDVHLMSYAFISTDFALHLLASPLHLLCPGFLSQHSTFARFACLLLSSLLRRRRRERSDALWSPLSSPFTKCISREGKLKRKMCNFAAQSTETNKNRKSNFPLDGSADVGSALKQWLGCPVQQFQCNVRGPQRTLCMINAL